MNRITEVLELNPVQWLAALIIGFLGYLSPIKNVVHVMLFFFLIDVIYGYKAAKKLRGERFKPRVIWEKTMPRVTLSVILLVCAFMLDESTGQTYVSIYKILAWAVSALILVSIARNGYIVTNWEIIPLIGKIIQTKVDEQIGLKMEAENQNNIHDENG